MLVNSRRGFAVVEARPVKPPSTLAAATGRLRGLLMPDIRRR
jgi:hypothetical protein